MMLYTVFIDKKLRKLFTITVILICSLILGISILLTYNRPIGVDTGIILKEMESIAEGYVPYKTMHLNYPPLFFYLMVGLKKLFNVPYGYYAFYLTIHNAMLLGAGYFIYLLSRFFGGRKMLSFLTMCSFIIIIIWHQGCMVLFEVPSMFWGLLATCFIMQRREKKNRVIIGGFLSSLSFLTKQFGAAFIGINVYLLLSNELDRKKNLLYYIIGVAIPIVFIYLWGGMDFIESILFNGYGTTNNALAGEDTSIKTKMTHIFLGWNDLVSTCPIVLILFLSIFTKTRSENNIFLGYCILGMILFSFQFYFVYPCAPHYFQYFVPYAVLALPLIFSARTPNFVRYIALCIFSYTIVKGVIISFYSPIMNYREYSSFKNRQICNSKIIKRQVRNDETVWIANTDLLMYYYLVDAKTPNMKEVGYSSGPWEVTIDKATMQVENADFVLCHYDELKNDNQDYYFTNDLRAFVYSKPFIGLSENIRLYKMN